MMISPESYIMKMKNKSYEELLKERDELLKEVTEFELNENKDGNNIFQPAQEVVYQCNLKYLGKLFDLISHKYNKKYIVSNEDNDEENYTYVSVSYDDDINGNLYFYKTIYDDIEIGDIVLVDRNGHRAEATVEDIKKYTKDTVPYPIEKTKDIIEIVEKYDDEII